MSCLLCIRIFYKFSYAFTEVFTAGSISPRFVSWGCIQNAWSIRSVRDLDELSALHQNLLQVLICFHRSLHGREYQPAFRFWGLYPERVEHQISARAR